jgi:hypothetical protein
VTIRRASGSKRKEGAEGWRQLHDEQLHTIYFSPNNFKVFKPKMTSEGHAVAYEWESSEIRITF